MSIPKTLSADCANNAVPYPVPQAASKTFLFLTKSLAKIYLFMCSTSSSKSTLPGTNLSPVKSTKKPPKKLI